MPEQYLPPAWSKSGLGDLLDGCAWQWTLKKVFGLDDPGSPATVRGTAMHAAIEHHERARLRDHRDHEPDPYPSLTELHDVAVATLHKAAPSVPDELWERHETSPGEVEGQLWDLLTNWRDGILPHLLTMRPVAVEPYFRADLGGGGRPGHGYIDEVLWDPGAHQWVVVDHKSAGNFRRWDSYLGHEVEGAMYVAGAALARHLPVDGPSVRMEWHVARLLRQSSRTGDLSRIISWEVDPSLAQEVAAEAVRDAEQMVVEGWLPKNTAWNLCSAKWCPFFDGCEVTGELAPETMLAGRGG